MTTNQEAKQASIRTITGTTNTYNGDWLALFDAASIASGSFNGRMIAWLQGETGSSKTNINDLQAAYAELLGFDQWNSVNVILDGIIITDSGDPITTDAGDVITTG